MKAKNLITMVLAGAFSVSLLAGCGASKTTESSAASSAAQTETQSSTADTTAAESSGFSFSCFAAFRTFRIIEIPQS